MKKLLKNAKNASKILATIKPKQKNECLKDMAKALNANKKEILKANYIDMQNAKKNNLSYAMLERLLLNEDRIEDMAKSIKQIARLEEPVGRVLDGWINDDSLEIQKITTPIGVIAVIYESRPNVTSDSVGLCFKSSNVCILKGGKEAYNSNKLIAETLQNCLLKHNLPKDAICFLEDNSRENVQKMLTMNEYIDLIIPRGGESLVRFVTENSNIAILKHDKGLCHTYIDKKADFKKAIQIALNAKTQRTGVCNAMETLLVHEKIAKDILPELKKAYDETKTELRACEKTKQIIEAKLATEEDFNTEYLDNILSIKIVKNINEAIEHISKYGSGHSEAIITEDYSMANKFLNSIDAACVYVNASTRFTDGAKFGFGAEIGISTNKLHARGPVGINELTTYKYIIRGNGQIRQ